YGCDRNLWSGGRLRIRVTDMFARGGPRLMHEGTSSSATIDLHLKLPFDAGQLYAFHFSAPKHRPAWQLIRRADFIRMPEPVEGDDLVLRLMLVPDAPGTSGLSQGFARLQERGSPLAAESSGLDLATYQDLDVAAQMALLNIEAKLRETYVEGASVLSFVKFVRHVAVDRLFLRVDASLKDRLARAADFAGAPGHAAPASLADVPAHPDSWKHRRFAEGNVQLSFSRETLAFEDGQGPLHSVDADIDLRKGLAHVAEWLENNVFRPGHTTNQALVYAMLYAQRILPLYTLDPLAATTSRFAVLRPTPSRPRATKSAAKRETRRTTRKTVRRAARKTVRKKKRHPRFRVSVDRPGQV
ncbi:MAG: hypothetical protein ACRD1H_01965, partial [Vicinamibacterales bacterium]